MKERATAFVCFQLFALYLKGRPTAQSTDEQPSRTSSLQAILFYGLIAVGQLLNNVTQNMSGTVADPAGIVWRLQDIYAVTGLIAIFTMGAFTIFGLVKLMDGAPAAQNVPAETTSRSAAPFSSEPQIERAVK